MMMMMMAATFRCLPVDPGVLCSGMTVQREPERRQRCDVDDDGENTSSSGQEFEDVGLREALSDSEVKVSPPFEWHFLFRPFQIHHSDKKNCFRQEADGRQERDPGGRGGQQDGGGSFLVMFHI